MLEIKRKRDRNFFLCFLASAFFIAYGFTLDDMGILKFAELKETEKRIKENIVMLEKRRDNLEKEINRIDVDPYFLEEHLQENHKMSKKEELIFFFISGESGE